jgi:DNA-binding FadR family transcriptional regulator
MREALRVLESDGLIKIQRGVKGGAQVQEPEVGRLARRVGLHLQLRGTDLHDMMQAEIVIHPGAVALAAVARTDHDLAELRAAIDRVAASTTPGRYAAAAAAFLDQLSHASHNEVLTLVSELTTELMRDVIGKSALRETWPTDHAELIIWSVEQYTTVVDLIEGRDGDAAERFWRDHLRLADYGDNVPSPLTVYRPWGPRRTPLRAVVDGRVGPTP